MCAGLGGGGARLSPPPGVEGGETACAAGESLACAVSPYALSAHTRTAPTHTTASAMGACLSSKGALIHGTFSQSARAKRVCHSSLHAEVRGHPSGTVLPVSDHLLVELFPIVIDREFVVVVDGDGESAHEAGSKVLAEWAGARRAGAGLGGSVRLPGQDGSDPVTKVAMYGCLSAPSMSSRLSGLKSMSLSTMSTASGGASFMSTAMSFLATWLGLGLGLGLGLRLRLGSGLGLNALLGYLGQAAEHRLSKGGVDGGDILSRRLAAHL